MTAVKAVSRGGGRLDVGAEVASEAALGETGSRGKMETSFLLETPAMYLRDTMLLWSLSVP